MIAALAQIPKLLPALLLVACAAIPFGIPRGTPASPIITSGVFALPDGAHLPYRTYPAIGPTKTVILALHGYTDSRDGFTYLAAALAPDGVTIYAPDQSSFGATANRGYWPGTATLVDEARDMALQLRAKYPTTKLYIAGESMGAAIGILVGASANSPPVDGYILSAPAVWGGATLSPVYRFMLRLADATIPAKRLTGQSAHVRASDNEAALLAFGRDPLTIHAPRLDNLAGLVALMGAAQAACANFNQPALILYGGHDQLVPPAAIRSCWLAIPRSAPVTLAYYPPDYHLLLRDNERATPDADIAGYLAGTGPASSAPSAATIFLGSN